jgi:hypothetical protein
LPVQEGELVQAENKIILQAIEGKLPAEKYLTTSQIQLEPTF